MYNMYVEGIRVFVKLMWRRKSMNKAKAGSRVDCLQSSIFSCNCRDLIFFDRTVAILLVLSPGCAERGKARWRPVDGNVLDHMKK